MIHLGNFIASLHFKWYLRTSVKGRANTQCIIASIGVYIYTAHLSPTLNEGSEMCSECSDAIRMCDELIILIVAFQNWNNYTPRNFKVENGMDPQIASSLNMWYTSLTDTSWRSCININTNDAAVVLTLVSDYTLVGSPVRGQQQSVSLIWIIIPD